MRSVLTVLRRSARHVSPGAVVAYPATSCQTRRYGDNTASKARSPFEGYSIDALDAPLTFTGATPTIEPPIPPPGTPSTPDPTPLSSDEDRIAKFRTVFGSPRERAAERKMEAEANSEVIAGIVVPPRPEEPENCCMSGCVNCVWDQYRDEMEEWALRSAMARTAMLAARDKAQINSAVSMDDDGAGSDSAWNGADDGGSTDLFADIPVGIREFMRTEKKLKERKRREAEAEGD
ncbi:hypothetical protein LTR62_001314 [Meristemomyces frigidus]|uniref:Oxidoreductase-like domain-containing protein n=1 Tax=Meristemomyces frigidus TaxID=1508187 RepID=A0AAN7TJV7_9PEZI|nr:hypothetical protein LTR62_001314 [Meristemomyces frigidus]